jgi:hypothetical protein
MEERLFYERGGRTGFDEVAAHVRAFLATHNVPGGTRLPG